MSFIDEAASGHARPDQIQSYIDMYMREHPRCTRTQLATFLGLSPVEYVLWQQDRRVLPKIIEARRELMYASEPHAEDVMWARDEVVGAIDRMVGDVRAEHSGYTSAWTMKCKRRERALLSIKELIQKAEEP